MADDDFSRLPSDAFVEIMQRLPTSSRRRSRLVCKHWRDVVDGGTAERQVRTKILAFISKCRSSRALVFDDQDGHRRRDWTYPSSLGVSGVVKMVGSCNGLICLHEISPFRDYFLSVATVANPVTGETRVLPPVPKTMDASTSPGIYVFGYHPITGRYKVVHVPTRVAQSPALDDGAAVQVLTLGDSSWRGVPLRSPGLSFYRFRRDDTIVSVDGSVYWLTARAEQIMALDLEDETTAVFDAPPSLQLQSDKTPAQIVSSHLTNVHARLGVAVRWHKRGVTSVEVWALESHKEGPRWSLRYNAIERLLKGQWSRACAHIGAALYSWRVYVLSASGRDLILRRTRSFCICREPGILRRTRSFCICRDSGATAKY